MYQIKKINLKTLAGPTQSLLGRFNSLDDAKQSMKNYDIQDGELIVCISYSGEVMLENFEKIECIRVNKVVMVE